MKKKCLLWFGNDIVVPSDVALGWDTLENPSDREFWEKVSQFRESKVVLIQQQENDRTMVLMAARQILEVTNDVGILPVRLGAVITAELLSKVRPLPVELRDIDDDDLVAIVDLEQFKEIHPSQDYWGDTIYYGARIKGRDYLVTSEPRLIPLIACPSLDISLLQPNLSTVGFSHGSVLDYLSGMGECPPETIHNEVVSYLKKYLYCQDPLTYDLLATWVLGTFIFRCFRYYPYLHLNAEKGSGKTLLMELLAPITFNGTLMAQPPASTVIKLIEQDSATLFIDEAEGLGAGKGVTGQLKSILKTGFARSGVYYLGNDKYRTYSPKCFAGIELLDDVLADRAITIRLMRKGGSDTIEQYRETPLMRKFQLELRDKIFHFGLRYGPSIGTDYNGETTLYDKLPHLTNRAYDVWLPLFKIVNSFSDEGYKSRVFQSLDELSQADARRRSSRDFDENDTGAMLNALEEILPILKPLDSNNNLQFFDPDAVYDAMRRMELIPRSLQKKGLSWMLKRTLDIPSIPRSYQGKTKRMYAIDVTDLDNYRKRYNDKVVT